MICMTTAVTNKKMIDLTGKVFGKLTVISLHSGGVRTYWNCVCECGKTAIANSQYLRDGRTKSCGCIKRYRVVEKNYKVKGQSGRTSKPKASTPTETVESRVYFNWGRDGKWIIPHTTITNKTV